MTERGSNITVVIPTHNDGELLERCLASIAAQTLQPDEVIVVDDGSSAAASVSGIERAMHRFPRTRLIRQANSGPSAARNRGLLEASSTFIAFVDADDEIASDNLAVKMALFGGSPDTVGTFAGILFVEPNGRTHQSRFKDYEGSLQADLIGKPEGVPGFLWAYMFRREALNGVNGLDEKLRIMEDFDALIRLGRLGGTFVGCNKPVYIQYRRLGSLARGSVERQLRGALNFLSIARRNRYFSKRELLRRYLRTPVDALKIIFLYGKLR